VANHRAWAGWRALIREAGRLLVFGPAGWAPLDELFDRVGVNSVADETNRLAVRAPATLLCHDGSNQ